MKKLKPFLLAWLVISIMLIALKCAGLIASSWWLITAPIWMPVAMIFSALVIFACIICCIDDDLAQPNADYHER